MSTAYLNRKGLRRKSRFFIAWSRKSTDYNVNAWEFHNVADQGYEVTR